MKKIMLILGVCIFLLTACKDDSNTDTPKETNQNSLLDQNKALQDQVQQLQQQLQEMQREEENNNGNEGTQDQSIGSLYPKLAFFTTGQNYKEIQIKTEQGSKEITDPLILKSLGNFFEITTELNFGSGPQADIEPVQYVVTTAANESMTVDIVGLGIASFPELYPGKYFSIDNDAYQLAKAFIDRPVYLEEESTISKMAQSGLVKIQDESELVFTDAGRIRSIALAYIHADKHEIAAPKDQSSPIQQLTFYYYGELIKMNLYEGKIQIIDSNEKWFEVNQEEIDPIKGSVSAA